MGLRRALAPWKASILVGAVVAALLVSCEARSTESDVFSTIGAPAPAADGPVTDAEKLWANAVSALCARRNKRVSPFDYRAAPSSELARYTTDVLEVWDDYARQVADFRPPRSYVEQARMLAGADASLREVLLAIRREAHAGNRRTVGWAVAALRESTDANFAVLDYVGVRECSRFLPYRLD